MKPIRVLVVDDSAAVRQAMSEIIDADPGLQVMSTAADAVQAVRRIRNEVPDVITLDVEMPQMDGVTFLRRIMAQHPIPVVMCSTLLEDNSRTLLEALEAGAVDVIRKPSLGIKDFIDKERAEICDKIRSAAGARLRPRTAVKAQKKLSPDEVLPPPSPTAMTKTTEHVVVVGASTGGTDALRVFLEKLPADSPPIAIVQHMPASFTRSLAERLDGLCAITVREAKDGDRLLRGHALIAPGGAKHLLIGRRGAQYYVQLRDGPLVTRHRPSADVLFRSAARSAGANAIGVIMTGMGDDGARGLKEMRDAGATTIGQDEATSVVYGMPKAAFEAGAVMRQLPLTKIAPAIMRR